MSVTAINAPTQPGVREQVSAEEWQARVDLAALCRLVAIEDMADLAATHISARVPGHDDQFLINPQGLMYEEVTASNLVKVNMDGETVMASPFPVSSVGFTTHSAVLMARPDVNCVVHTHTAAGMAFSSVDTELLPISQTSGYFYKHVGYHDWGGLGSNLDERERLARDLGQHRGLIMRNHGLLVAAPTTPAGWVMIYQLERICRTQLEAMAAANAMGKQVKLMPPEVADKTVESMSRNFQNAAEGKTNFDWEAYLRMLDETDDSYRH